MDKDFIFCDICGCSFDSQDKKFCQKCEFYNKGLKKYGKTKSNLDYQIEAGIKSIKFMINNLKSEVN